LTNQLACEKLRTEATPIIADPRRALA